MTAALQKVGLTDRGYRIEAHQKGVTKFHSFTKVLLVVNIALKNFTEFSIPIEGIAGVGWQSSDELLSSMVEDAVEVLTDSPWFAGVQRLDNASSTEDDLEKSTVADSSQGVCNLSVCGIVYDGC